MILVFQKYHFNFTAGDAKLCWISIFTFSSPILFILFLCFWGTLASAFYAPCLWLGQFLFVKKQKWASCSLAPTAVPCATWLPFLCYSYLSIFFSLPSSLCSSLCLLFAQNTLDLEASAGALHAQAPPATLLNPLPPPPPPPFWIPCAHFQPNPMKFLLLAIKI